MADTDVVGEKNAGQRPVCWSTNSRDSPGDLRRVAIGPSALHSQSDEDCCFCCEKHVGNARILNAAVELLAQNLRFKCSNKNII